MYVASVRFPDSGGEGVYSTAKITRGQQQHTATGHHALHTSVYECVQCASLACRCSAFPRRWVSLDSPSPSRVLPPRTPSQLRRSRLATYPCVIIQHEAARRGC